MSPLMLEENLEKIVWMFSEKQSLLFFQVAIVLTVKGYPAPTGVKE